MSERIHVLGIGSLFYLQMRKGEGMNELKIFTRMLVNGDRPERE